MSNAVMSYYDRENNSNSNSKNNNDDKANISEAMSSWHNDNEESYSLERHQQQFQEQQQRLHQQQLQDQQQPHQQQLQEQLHQQQTQELNQMQQYEQSHHLNLINESPFNNISGCDLNFDMSREGFASLFDSPSFRSSSSRNSSNDVPTRNSSNDIPTSSFPMADIDAYSNMSPSPKKNELGPDLFAGGWQTDNDLAERKDVVVSIAILLKKLMRENSSDEMLQKLPRMAKRLEEHLYRTAETKDEYLNKNTLHQRIQIVAQALDIHRPRSFPTSFDTSNFSGVGDGDSNSYAINMKSLDVNDSSELCSTTRWQSEIDMPDRHIITSQIVRLIQQQNTNSKNQNKRKLSDLASKLEQHLYNVSKSREEYVDISTLEMRLQIISQALGAQRSSLAGGTTL